MEKVLQLIKENNLFNTGASLGVAVSGGSDSMALLHFLNANKEELDIEIVALHVDHCLRETSGADAAFVARFCRENHIRLVKCKVDVNEIMQIKKMGIEQAAREARYEFFNATIKKGVVEKVVTAHHVSDQAETVLMHILRGAGLNGAKGMDIVRGDFIRPLLTTEKSEIMDYIYNNNIEFVEDETNTDPRFTRNFVRNKIMPLFRERFMNAEKNLANFASVCREDDAYIQQFALMDGVFAEENYVKIPLSYFSFNPSIISRIIVKALAQIGINEDFERKHLVLIKELTALENGSKIDLPSGAKAFKEYEYITVMRSNKETKIAETFKFKPGKTKINGFGTIIIKKVDPKTDVTDKHIVDISVLPKSAVWRIRQEGDYLVKFGGGTKKLKAYLIEKKIPQRLRSNIPVLAAENEVFVVACIAISNKLKIDENSKTAYSIEYEVE